MSLSTNCRVVYTPELLRYIFQCLDGPDNFANALVCKTWCNEALNVLWRVIWYPRRLFELLAPLERKGDHLVFSRSVGPEDWTRFNQYSWRVHELSDDIDWDQYHISILTTISLTRPTLQLLPNLRKLTYYFAPPYFLPMYFSSSLRELHLRSSTTEISHDMRNVAMAMQYLPSRTPHLTALVLHGTFATNLIKPVFSKMVAALPQIKTLEIPSNLLSLATWTIIASLPALQTWTVNTPETQADPSASFLPPNFSDDTFSSLTSLTLALPFHNAADWFSRISPLPALTYFELRPVDAGTLMDYGRLVQGIGASLQKLERFSVNEFHVPHSAAPTDPITFVQLEPIVQCANLTSLLLHHPTPFQLDAAHILSIVKSLPSLISLSLNPRPQERLDLPPSLDLDVLPALIPYCPKLTFLALYLNACKPPVQKMRGPFQQLQTLDVGCSPIGDAAKVASFLSAVLPRRCAVRSECDHTNRRKWGQVTQLVPVFLDVRDVERDGIAQS